MGASDLVKALILGGAGFIGFHLVSKLLADSKTQVTLVDNFSRGARDVELEELLATNANLNMLTGDLTDPGTFNQLNEKFDEIYLFASVVGVGNVQADPTNVIRTNSLIILNTLEWVRQVGCGRLLFSSSSETYAGAVESGLTGVPTSESAPAVLMDIQHPRSTYALTKMLGESAVTHYSNDLGFEAVITRYHNVYGPRMGFNHVIPELMERITQGFDPLPVYGMDQTRAFCYVSDAVDASRALMSCKLDGCQIVHVGNDREEIRVRDLLEKMLKIEDSHPAIEELTAPSASVDRRCPDISKLRSLTGFEPQVNIDQGLDLTLDWYRSVLHSATGPVGPR
jgi:UDP-glucuronate decarboxylase